MLRSARAGTIAALLASALAGLTSCRRPPSEPASFVGSDACAQCHAAEHSAWRGSQHAVAMQVATPRTVLARFDGTQFTNAGIAYTFGRRGDTSIVNTIGPAGRPADFMVRYTFGVWPLQQYIVELPGGKLQALLAAWDARPSNEGGLRWFSLSPGAEAAHADRFHWSGRQFNWNYMCADCHSTAVRKNYVAEADSFDTKFAAINVSCEACHGPGSRHASWGRSASLLRKTIWRDNGLTAQLSDRRGAAWVRDSAAPVAHRTVPRSGEHEIETCTQCHARRNHIADGYTAGAPLLDYYAPIPLMPGMYHPDGQQREEVYTVASFQQSKMYPAGVTCSDCHNPHTGKTRLPGNQVCAQCHSPAKYDAPSHHFHKATGPGAQCVACHMPDSAYMQIDRRHDHSLRIPRPDLSVSLGVPNACSRCHTDRSAAWAADALRKWYPSPNPGFQRFTAAFAADERGDPGAADSLSHILNDATEPWIVRASALARLGAHASPVVLQAAQQWSRDPNPVIRLYAMELVEGYGERERIAVAAPLLSDARRAIRQEAAWLVAPVAQSLDANTRRAFDVAAAEFVASQRYNADRAPSRLRLASFYAQVGRVDSAAIEVRAAALLDSSATSDFMRTVRGAAQRDPNAAALLHAMQQGAR
jgi:nitrate/TMAO reductase-like tetraheme cytochrome c subunit